MTVEQPEPVRRILRGYKRAMAAVVGLLLVVGLCIGVIVSYAHSNAALRGEVASNHTAAATSQEAKEIAACVNAILGTRSVPTANDAEAHIVFAQAIENVLSKKISYDDFLRILHSYVATLTTDQADRDIHPLGHC